MGLSTRRPLVQQLVTLHYEGLYRYAFRLCGGSAAEAEDITQETFCKAQRKLAQLRSADRAKAWLFSILRNTYLHRCRDRRQLCVLPLEAVGELPDPASADGAGPLEVEPAQLQAALNALPEEFRTPLILYYFEDFSYRDIAEQMEVPLGTVMSRLARAKEHLRRRLAPAVAEANGSPLSPVPQEARR